MNIVNRYIGRDFLITFGITLGVLTFVMSTAGLVRAIDLLARGMSGTFLLRMFLINIPYMMMFSIPMSTLAATLLMIGRLSADGEITAMKACGINLWQIVSPVILYSIVLSVICLVVSAEIAPRCKHAQRMMLRELKVETPINLLEEGTFVSDFPNLKIYIGRKDGMELEDIWVFQSSEGEAPASLRAQSGLIRPESDDVVYIDLYGVRYFRPNSDADEQASRAPVAVGTYTKKLDLSEMRKADAPRKKLSDMTMAELVAQLEEVRAMREDIDRESYAQMRAGILVEANQRMALSLSCFAFTLLGIPLGLKSRRRESSVGIAISLLLVFCFYFFIILAESLVKKPWLRPELITWAPVIGMEIIGAILIRRNR